MTSVAKLNSNELRHENKVSATRTPLLGVVKSSTDLIPDG